MDCIDCRDALSARIDGEPDFEASSELVDRHLRTCADCREWQARAAALTRQLRVGPAVPTPDFTQAVLDAADALHTPRGLGGLGGLRGRMALRHRPRLPAPASVTARLALALAGWAQLGLGLLQLVDSRGVTTHVVGESHHASTSHLFNESVAWNLAVGVGMLWAAAQTRRAGGMFTALLGAVVVLAGFSVHDLTTQTVGATRVASHAVLLVGLGLLYLVDRTHQSGEPTPGQHRADLPGHAGVAQALDAPVSRRRRRGPPPLRPAGRRRAA